MKKTWIIGVGVVVVLVGVIAYLAMPKDAVAPVATETENVENTQEQVDMPQETADEVEGETYTISEGSNVQYIAQKEWFSKPHQEVVGENTSVSGMATYDVETRTLASLGAVVDSQGFVSDSSGRDRDMQKRLTSPIEIVLAEPIVLDENAMYAGTAMLGVSINGVQRITPFDVNISMESGVIAASGTADLVLPEFDFEPPSLLNVYSVNEVLGVAFDITLKQAE